jgi:hypothetical protein
MGYDNIDKCKKCGGENEVKVTDQVGGRGIIIEASTICTSCGYEDYWVQGYFTCVCTMPKKDIFLGLLICGVMVLCLLGFAAFGGLK